MMRRLAALLVVVVLPVVASDAAADAAPDSPAASAAAAAAASPAAAAASPQSMCRCDAPFVAWGALCLHVVAAGAFEPVQMACRSRGGRLAALRTPAERRAARQVLRAFRYNQAWIGLQRSGAAGERTWRWSDGSAAADARWRAAPSPAAGDCGTLTLWHGWTARHCSQWRAVGICYRPARSDADRCRPAGQLPLTQRLQQLLGGGGAQRAADGTPAAPPPPPRLRLAVEGRPPVLTAPGRNRLPLMDTRVLWHHWM